MLSVSPTSHAMSTLWMVLGLVVVVWLFILLHSLVRRPLLAQCQLNYIHTHRRTRSHQRLSVYPCVSQAHMKVTSNLCLASLFLVAADSLVNPKVNLGKVAGVHSIQGQRAHMEDSYYADCQKGFFAVYDGHGGARASQFASKHLHDLLFQHLPPSTPASLAHSPSGSSLSSISSSLSSSLLQSSSTASTPNSHSASSAAASTSASPSSALTSAFLDLDRQWLDLASVNSWDDGSTAISALIHSHTLYVANVGDSRAVLASSGQAIDMSSDHKPSRLDEKERIEALGGRIIHYGTWRVEGVLAVTRSIGDRRLKKYVSAHPEVRVRRLQAGDDWLILASDGVWDVMSSQQAVDVVCGCADVRQAAILLTNTAYQRNSQDNITTMIVDLRPYR